MTHLQLLLLCVALLAGGALISLILARYRRLSGWVSFVAVTAASIVIWIVIVRSFVAGGEPETSLFGLPVLGAQLVLKVDLLSAFFLALVTLIAVVSTLYSVEYMTHYKGDSVAKFYPVLLVFFISIIGVLVTVDMLFFLVCWEMMTLTSFFLVTFERESAASQRAGLKYFIITHAATLCIVVAVLLLWKQCGSFHFAEMHSALKSLLATRPVVGHLVIVLFALGFATKAGILPMGDWLPDAHPVAPTGMSAVLSGALVKLGFYGLIRLFCSFVPVSPALHGWGIALAVAGSVSLFVGTLTALKQTDSKRLMAFSTIGQIGYICLGLGVGVTCLPSSPALAALALMASLLHAMNHACFKACLFLGAGAVLYRTGERDMNKLGGLGTAMPATAGSTLVATLSIAGVPPLNGFTSKWLIVVTCLLAGMTSPVLLVLGLIAMFVSLATLAALLKVLAAVFLGRPRANQHVEEVHPTMVIPQLILAGLCIVLGVVPQLPLMLLHHAVAAVSQIPLPGFDALLGGPWSLTVFVNGSSVACWAPLVIMGGISLLALVAYAIQRAGSANRRDVPVWTCGEEHGPDLVRYPASSLYLPFSQILERIYPSLRLRAPRFPRLLRRVLELDHWLYDPAARQVERAARGMSRTHVGTPQVYLLWITLGAAAVIVTMLLAIS